MAQPLMDATASPWRYVLVNEGFEPLMSALERAHRKGYMPDAITDDYEGFDYRDDDAKEPAYTEQAMNLMRVRQFALESASGHLGSLIDDQRRLLAWAYSKLAHTEWARQDDALAMDEIKLILMVAA